MQSTSDHGQYLLNWYHPLPRRQYGHARDPDQSSGLLVLRGDLTHTPTPDERIQLELAAQLAAKRDEALMQAVIQLAHALELKVTVEGVKTGEQVELMRQQECEYV
ncbi:EAL domain-containing protein [Deinococcus aquatilis]|uniref:EAL domain-containing protein n=1 Tax=Deinococcus aquatilis TaxID=519440 RepID=UPI0003A07937|nr:EAL domain-containing protein [Deinococcus aquatilis]